MTVRKTVKTTLTIVTFLLGLRFSLGSDFVLNNTLTQWETATYLTSAFFPNLIYYSLILMLIAFLYDVIMNKRVAFGLLSSMNLPLILIFSGFTILLFTIEINPIIQLGTFLIMNLLVIYLTFRKLLSAYLLTVGVYSKLSRNLFKGLYHSIEKIIEIEGLDDEDIDKGNLIDRLFFYLITSLVGILTIVTLISVVVYWLSYWEYVF